MSIKQFLKPNKKKIIISFLLIPLIFVLSFILAVLLSFLSYPYSHLFFLGNTFIFLLHSLNKIFYYIMTGRPLFVLEGMFLGPCLFCYYISIVLSLLAGGVIIYFLSCIITLLVSKDVSPKKKVLIAIGTVLALGIVEGLYLQEEKRIEKMVKLEHCVEACPVLEGYKYPDIKTVEPQCLEACLRKYGVSLEEFGEWREMRGF